MLEYTIWIYPIFEQGRMNWTKIFIGKDADEDSEQTSGERVTLYPIFKLGRNGYDDSHFYWASNLYHTNTFRFQKEPIDFRLQLKQQLMNLNLSDLKTM